MKLTSYKLSPRGFTLLEIVMAAAIFSITLLTAVALFTTTTRAQKKVQSLARVQDDARFMVESMAQAVRLNGIDYSYYLNADADPATPPVPADLSAQAVDELVTMSAKDGRKFFRWFPATSKIGACSQSPAELISNPTKCLLTGSPYEDITPSNVTIEKFKVFISPGSDPYVPPPTEAADCRTNQTAGAGVYGYSADIGVCTCDTVVDHCFTDQTCVLTSTAKVCKPTNEQPRATIVITSVTGSGGEQFRSTFQTTVSARTYRR